MTDSANETATRWKQRFELPSAAGSDLEFIGDLVGVERDPRGFYRWRTVPAVRNSYILIFRLNYDFERA